MERTDERREEEEDKSEMLGGVGGGDVFLILCFAMLHLPPSAHLHLRCDHF